MTDQAVYTSTPQRIFIILIIERIFHAVCMGSAALLPFYFIGNGLDEIYFGSTSAISAVIAIIIILFLPFIMKKVRVKKIALASGMFFLSGYALLLYGNQQPESLKALGFVCVPLISAGWITHFTLGSIKVSAASSDTTRQQNFMIYAAFSTLGISLGPIIGKMVLSVDDSFSYLFGLLIALSLMGFMASIATGGGSADGLSTSTASETSRTDGIGEILQSPALFFVFMVLLQSAIFTIIINFQVVFGEQNGLSSSVFFTCWAIGIMVPRLVLGGWIAKRDNRIVLPILTACLGISLFALAAGPSSNLLYGMAAVSLGVFYGLSYPIVQAETVKYATISTRSFFLVAFSLAYFISYYVTPLAAGILVSIHGYNQLFFIAGLIAMSMVVAEFGFYRSRYSKQRTL
ncbi:major facilitator family transporter [Nitratireductor indicus C115]|uniref:Major facilitator family transporter n=1 Tax=Nitratireductor indicus C115 TaxID=1231190 RepID=K2NS42_9HYPH|nr:MFS transporter [Nitratireductor indicus]EKF40579.1 major facilitator family transporter [Nitratireductor indicus C115]